MTEHGYRIVYHKTDRGNWFVALWKDNTELEWDILPSKWSAFKYKRKLRRKVKKYETN